MVKKKGIDLRLLAGSGINIPFVNNNTSGRLVMSRNQSVQVPSITNPEDKIVDTGYSTQLKNFTYDVVIDNDTVFLKMIKKYNNRSDIWNNDEWSSIILMGHDTVENELVHYEISRFRILGNKFGISYTIDEEYLYGLIMRDIIPAGTRLSWAQGNGGNTHKTGKNLNVAICSIPEVGEDCIVMSDRILKDYGIKLYEKYEVSYGKTSIMANVHSDNNDGYKAFPDLGDEVKASHVLFSKIDLDLRSLKKEDYSVINDAILFTDKGLKTRRPHFTNHTLVKNDGRVVDVDIIYNPKSGENIELESTGMQTAGYLMMLRTYYKEVVDTYQFYKKNYPNSGVNVDTNNLIVDAMVYVEQPVRGRVPNIARVKKRTTLDMYTVKLTVESTFIPNQGSKFTDTYGGKGVIKIMRHEDMPRDGNGVVADIAMLSKGIIARTNLGKLYEHYFTASSRQTRDAIKDLLSVKKSRDIKTLLESEINTVYNYLLTYLSYFNTTQYKLYSGSYVGDNRFSPTGEIYNNKQVSLTEKIEILTEIFDRELYLVYNAAEEESAYEITCRLEDSPYKIKETSIYIKDPTTNEFKKMKSRGFIAPMYTVMLNKIADSFLGSSTFFLNGYGLPTGKSKEDNRFPYKFKGVRGWGESEIRLAAAYGSPRLMQILADRSRSIENHRKFYRNQLETGHVNNETLIPDRVEDSDIAINIIKAILDPAGVCIETKR